MPCNPFWQTQQASILQDNFLSAVSNERDLGVIVDHQLKFSSHAKSVSSSANKTLRIIKRTISSQHPRVLMKLYKALVHPRLEVGMSLAAPFYKKDKKLLEDVQHRATKMVSSMNKFLYEERLYCLKLLRLTYQRKRGDIISWSQCSLALVGYSLVSGAHCYLLYP